MATKQSNTYGEASIRVLKGLEPVKQRPGMYTRTDNPLHIIQEVIDNAADEALANFGQRIDVALHADGSISVEDDGRGIPFGLHPEEKVPVVEIVVTDEHGVPLPVGAVGEIWMIDVLLLQRLQCELRLAKDLVLPGQKLGPEVILLPVIHERLFFGRPVILQLFQGQPICRAMQTKKCSFAVGLIQIGAILQRRCDPK